MPTSKEIELLEKFASMEHDRWARWQKHLHSKLYPIGNNYPNPHLLVLPTELYQRWERQINTPYSELSEQEKESDRRETKPYFDLLSLALEEKVKQFSNDMEELRKIHRMELDAVAAKSLNDFIIWSNNRKL